MKGEIVFFIGQQDWDNEVGSNAVNLAMEMSKSNKVIYINNSLDRNTIKKKASDAKVQRKLDIVRGKSEDLVKINDNLYLFYPKTVLESINWLPKGFVYDFFNKLNGKRLTNEINGLAERLKCNGNYVLFNDCLISKSLYFKRYLKYKRYFYYIRDNFKPIPYFQKHAIAEQEKIMGYVDAVFANSGFLAKYAQQFNVKAYDIGQGCDLELYLRENIEADIDFEKIPKPIVGYTGYLTSMRLDIELIKSIAVGLPDCSIVLVGPEDEKFMNSDLHGIKNVYFLGKKAPETMPNFICAFDVCINPQLVNELTVGNYPRKVDEYLAMGKPVVATKTDFMSYFADCCYLASNHQEYIQLIEKAVSENSVQNQEYRRKVALGHSWEENVKKIYQIISENRFI